jgi:acetyl-CoA carboxylase carboxyltransferase component
VAVMGAEGAVNIVYRDQIRMDAEPDAKRAELVEEYERLFMNPYVAASRGLIDDVIDPADTRPKIVHALEMLENKRETLPPKKHGSIPL